MHNPLASGDSIVKSDRIGTSRTGAPGRLIVFEGLDGAGKTTQIELLTRRLRQKGIPVVITSWNSSRLISKAIKRAKKAQMLTPYVYSTLHAADFMYRLENLIMPALHEGAVVIADRYSYSARAWDLAGDVDRRWVQGLYALAPSPDLAFYCTASVEESLEFQARVASEYDQMRKDFGLIEIDSTASISEVHEYVNSIVEEHLKRWNGGDGAGRSPEAAVGSKVSRAESKGVNRANSLAASEPHTFPGRLVVLESADKHAALRQANLLYNELLLQGYDVRLASLGNSWIGIEVARKALAKAVMSLPTKVFLSAAEIALYHEEVIVPALLSGAVVIMDGYLQSLYTSAVANGLHAEWFTPMFQIFHIKPDRTILLDIPLRDIIRKKSLRPSANIFSDMTHETGAEVSIQSAIIELYRDLAEAEGWSKLPAASEKETHRLVLAELTGTILPALRRGAANEPLREVLDLFSHYDHDFDHPRKVAELACSLFDQTLHLHGFAANERNLLVYASMLHDIGHAVSETRHEEFTYEAIIRHRFGSMSEHDREIIANIAYLHRQPLAKMKFLHLESLNEADQLRVRRLAALLRIADALDESGKRVVHDVRCYEEQGVLTIDLRAVSKALPERSAVCRKADLFESVYRKTIVVVRNRLEKRTRDSRRLEAERIGRRDS